ncbi:MAG: hypothetical protein AAB701_01780 [Patescibacteria group bacterium]
MSNTENKPSRFFYFWFVPLILLVAVVAIPFIILSMIARGFKELFVQFLVAIFWEPIQINGVLLYSEHPEWHNWSLQLTRKHNLIPLNWNERKHWQPSLATLVLYTFGRSNRTLKNDQQNERRFFYPLAVMTKRALPPKRIYFAKAWQEKFKGMSNLLHANEAELDSFDRQVRNSSSST